MNSTAVNGGGAKGGRPPGQLGGVSHQHAALTGVIEPVAAAAGLDLEGVEIKTAGRRRVVRIFVDRDGGVSLDEIADISTAISARLDQIDPVGDVPYVLEVSSPGVDRPLTLPRHWRRAVGRLVRATMIEGGDLRGRLIDVSDDAVTIEIGGAARRHSYAEIAKARVEVEFNRPASLVDKEDEEV